VDITIPNGDGSTPIDSASGNGHTEVVKLLLEHDADITILDERGWLPIHAASAGNHADVVKILLESGANLTSQIKMGIRRSAWLLGMVTLDL
jgi:ankyrin repeat protein